MKVYIAVLGTCCHKFLCRKTLKDRIVGQCTQVYRRGDTPGGWRGVLRHAITPSAIYVSTL